MKELREEYEGILVPGTVAAFQKEGTGGFVLALSASTAQIPYVIDPRSPLFQQPLPKPKKSHQSLKHILGLPSDYEPNAESFNADLVNAGLFAAIVCFFIYWALQNKLSNAEELAQANSN